MIARLAATVAVALAVVAAGPLHAQKRADPAKTLRVMFPIAETGFDPQATSDLYSGHVQRAIFEPLFAYDYLARPYRLVPNTAAALPEISPDGRTWTIRIRPGILFADDPAFKGRPRELTAHDYVFAWKRLLDPRMRSPYLWYLDGKLVGADKVLARAKEAGRLDYDAEIEGLRALDRHTLQLKLVDPDYILLGYMAHNAMSAVAREVVEAYGDASGWVMANPVGTGPFRLAEWRRGQKIVLEANPGFREETFPAAGEPGDAALIAKMKGKRLPQVGRVEVSIIEESNPQLLAFNSGELDYANVPGDLVPNVLEGGKLKPYYAQQGVHHWRLTQPALAYAYFNMEDPVVGGYSPDKVALRRAIVMGFDVRELIDVWYQGQAIEANQPIPPVVSGHADGAVAGGVPHDPKLAMQLLDRFGYKDRDGDGFRELPDGRPLALVMGTATSGRDRARDELWKKSMTRIGIRIDFLVQKWPDLLKMGRAGKLQMWPVGWITQYNEGDAFMQLLYSKNIGQSNYSRFALPEYDELYLRTKRIPAGPERTALYRKMAELVNAYNPWDLGVWRIENTLVRPWVDGYKKHAFHEHAWKYYDIDAAARKAAARR
ncbi:MAG TPA: ABC transporter substrate-binding protein [Casimicrobiaceae bacterium]|nr:ABC transporter substrate-binding protein [Casimicrobiaceae bacterium]